MLIPLLFLTLGLTPFKWAGISPVQFDATATPTATSGTPVVVISTSTPLDDGSVYHVVQPNEALWSIALAYNTTVEQLKLLNSLKNNEIFIGQKILVSRPEPATASPAPTFTVTLGIPTSTPTYPVTPTITSTVTPLPSPPTSQQAGLTVLGIIVLIALLGAALGSWLGAKK